MMTQKTSSSKLMIVLVVLLAASTGYFGYEYIQLKKPNRDQVLLQTANNLTKTCPMQLDQATRLDNVTSFPNNVLQYNYTLINLYRQDVDAEGVIKGLEPVIIGKVKKDPEMKELREAFTTFVYMYRDRNGEFIFKITLTPNKYLLQ